jgi:gamma-glutamyltranspeptidase/glutathione hydrolase
MLTRPELQGSFGMVASTHWLASAAGMTVLERGGNAFDAAVAAGFVMQVVEPHLSGPGGDLVGLVWPGGRKEPQVVCGQGVAPAGLTLRHLDQLGLTIVPGSGFLPATVPGAFDGWLTILQRWGTWHLADVLAFAVHYAESGFPILASTSAAIEAVRELFVEHWTTSADIWLDRGSVPAPGTRWRWPAVATTYRRLAQISEPGSRDHGIEQARQAFYAGFVAEAIHDFVRAPARDSSGADHAGLLTGEDLAAWRAGVEDPISVDVLGRYRLYKSPPWGQGPVLAQNVRLFEAAGGFELPVRSAAWIHTLVESSKLAYADREAWYGDPTFTDIPLDTLLAKDYAATRSSLITPAASLELRPGRPDDRGPRLPTFSPQTSLADGASGEPTVAPDGRTKGDTCHVDVVDRWGNMVSVTPSGGWLQSSPVIPGLGFPLGNRGQMFNVSPDLPNTLRPGARPRTTLTPSMASRDGEAWLAFGTPGGDQQDQWQAVLFCDIVQSDRGGGVNLQRAIDAPLFHSTHFPSSFYPRESAPGQLIVEDRLGVAVIDELAARGHRITRAGDWSLGRLSAVAKEGDWLRAAANPRVSQGYAVGR